MKVRAVSVSVLTVLLGGCSAPKDGKPRRSFWDTHSFTGTIAWEHGDDRVSGSLTISPFSGKEVVASK